MAAPSLARSLRSGATSTEAIPVVILEASEWLRNTPVIVKEAYVNPSVIVLFEQGKVAGLGRQRDGAVLALALLDSGAGQCLKWL